MTDIEPTPPDSDVDETVEDLLEKTVKQMNATILKLPAELKISRDLLVLYAAHANERGTMPVPDDALHLQQLSAIVNLERRILRIEKHLGI